MLKATSLDEGVVRTSVPAVFLFDRARIPTLRAYFLLSVLLTSVNVSYSMLRLPGPITFFLAFMLLMVTGIRRVFGQWFSAPSVRQTLRGIVMALAWPLVCKRL